jgi:hypothetical protein
MLKIREQQAKQQKDQLAEGTGSLSHFEGDLHLISIGTPTAD